MKSIAIVTEDFSVYPDLVRALRRRDLAFESLTFDDPIPDRVGAVITTEAERHRIDSSNVVVMDGDAREAVASAKRMLAGKDKYGTLIFGVDPGRTPGLAVIGDGDLLWATEAEGPEEVAELVQDAIDAYPSAAYRLRIGHGAATHRDRILNSLTSVPVPVEIVDEARTTPSEIRLRDERDIAAAIRIALSEGHAIPKRTRSPDPSEGEVRDVQDRSRRASSGAVTISRDLARKVAAGKMSMDKAIDRQQADD